jgi:hypothetical protein
LGTLKLNAKTLQFRKLEVQHYDTYSCTETYKFTKVDRSYL